MDKLITGQILFTKDGRKIGNAIVINIVECSHFRELYIIQTDFGNRARLTHKEIDSLYYICNDTGDIVVNDIGIRNYDQSQLINEEK